MNRVLSFFLVIFLLISSFPIQVFATDEGITLDDIIENTGKLCDKSDLIYSFKGSGVFYYHPTENVFLKPAYKYAEYTVFFGTSTTTLTPIGRIYFKGDYLVTNPEDIKALTIMSLAANPKSSIALSSIITLAELWSEGFERNVFSQTVQESINVLSNALGRIIAKGNVAEILPALAEATLDEIQEVLQDLEATFSTIELYLLKMLANKMQTKLAEYEAPAAHNIHTYKGSVSYIEQLIDLERTTLTSHVLGSQVLAPDGKSTFCTRFLNSLGECAKKFGSGFAGEFLSYLKNNPTALKKMTSGEDKSLAIMIEHAGKLCKVMEETNNLDFVINYANLDNMLKQFCRPLYDTMITYKGVGWGIGHPFLNYEQEKNLTVTSNMVSLCTNSGSSSVGTSGSANSTGVLPANYVVGDYRITATDGLRLRTAPSTSADCPLGIPYGTTVTVTQISDRWGYTAYNGYYGWIYLDYAAYVGVGGVMTMQLGPWEYSQTPTRALTQGTVGNDVKWLQAALNIVMGSELDTDGSFGPATYNAVISFQSGHGLAVDGSFGPASLSTMVGCLYNKGYAATAVSGNGEAGPDEIYRTSNSGYYNYYEFSNYSIKIGNMTFPTTEYPNGSYFTTTGNACVGHNACKHFYNSGIDIGSQCMGFARYMYYNLFGTIDYDGNPLVNTYYESGSTITVDYLKQILNMSTGKVKPGSHIRTMTGISGNQHSIMYLGCDENYVYTYECNYRGNCSVSVLKYTWEDFKNYLTKEKQGIHYINVPTTPLSFNVISTVIPEEVEKETSDGNFTYYDFANYSIKIGDTIFPSAEFPNGSYFTTTGTACVNHNACRHFILDDTDVGMQSLGFARYIFYKLFGTVDYDGNPEVITYYEEDSEITIEYLKEILNMNTGKVKPGSHLRSLSDTFDAGHSMIYLGCDDVYVYVYEANFNGDCGISVMKYTWENFKNYLTQNEMKGIHYINVPATPLAFTVLSAQTCCVTFDANGGNVDTQEKVVYSNELYGILPIPEKESYVFTGWYTEAAGGTRVTDTSIVNSASNHTLYAQWIPVAPAELTMSHTSLNLEVGEKQTVTVEVLPQNAADKSVSWDSADTTVATVEDGVITAIGKGTTNIYAIANDGLIRSVCSVSVAHQHTYENGYCTDCGSLQIIASGTIGTSDFVWALDGTGLLTISGTGNMPDIAESSRPWMSYKDFIKSISISEGVIGVTSYAFAYCTALTSVELPSSLSSLSVAMFEGCTALERIVLPENVKNINIQAFWKCSLLKDVELPDGLLSIGNSAFRETALTEITLPKNLEIIDRYAFAFCPSLISVTVPSSVQAIEGYAFNSSKSLDRVVILAKEAVIDENAFAEVNKEILTVYCYKDHTAATVAQNSGINVAYIQCEDGKHIYTDGICAVCNHLNGDMDGDGFVRVIDGLKILNSVLNGLALKDADVNGDGKITLLDVLRIFKLYVLK